MTCNYCGFDNADDALICIKCGAALENLASKPIKRNNNSSFGQTVGDRGDSSPAPVVENKERIYGKTIRDPDYSLEETSKIEADINKDILQVCEKCGFLNAGDAEVCTNCRVPLIKKTESKTAKDKVAKDNYADMHPNKLKDSDWYAEYLLKHKTTPVDILDSDVLQESDSETTVNIGSSFKETIDPYGNQQNFKRETKQFSFRPVAKEGELKITGGWDYRKIEFEFGSEPVQLNRNNLDVNNYTITSKVQAEVFCKDGKWYIADKSELKTTFVQANNPIEIKSGDVLLVGDRKFIFSTDTDEKIDSSTDFKSTHL